MHMQSHAEVGTHTPVFDSRIDESELTITPQAREKMRSLFDEVDDDIQAIRVFVTGGGCSGMSYGMTFTDQHYDTDCVLEQDGFQIYVDVVAMSFLRGVEIDFTDRGPSGASFVFNNAFRSAAGGGGCAGCGASAR